MPICCCNDSDSEMSRSNLYVGDLAASPSVQIFVLSSMPVGCCACGGGLRGEMRSLVRRLSIVSSWLMGLQTTGLASPECECLCPLVAGVDGN